MLSCKLTRREWLRYSGLLALSVLSKSSSAFEGVEEEIEERSKADNLETVIYDEELICNMVLCIRQKNIIGELEYSISTKKPVEMLSSKTGHGTGLLYRIKDGKGYIATCSHLSDPPYVKKEERMIRTLNWIVDNAEDQDKENDITLNLYSRKNVADVAILTADMEELIEKSPVLKRLFDTKWIDHKKDKIIIPWSSKIEYNEKAPVIVFGFPLGLMHATNTGKITNASHKDIQQAYGWEHECFVYDTQTNPGNSGSPIFLRVSNNGKNGYKWIGMHHAQFKAAKGLELGVKLKEFEHLLRLEKEKEEYKDPYEYDGITKKITKMDYEKIRGMSNSIPFFYYITNLPATVSVISGNRISTVLYTQAGSQDLSSKLELVAHYDNESGEYKPQTLIVFGMDKKEIKLIGLKKNEYEQVLAFFRGSVNCFIDSYELNKKRKENSRYKKEIEDSEAKLSLTDDHRKQQFEILKQIFEIE